MANPDPEILKQRHTDWPWPFKWVPRSWTAVRWGPPKMIWGDQIRKRKPVGQDRWAPAPIGEPSSFQVSRYPGAPGPLKYLPLYLAISLPKDTNGWYRHFRLGCRWDDVDGYCTWSIAMRRYPVSGERETSI
jgi:hypothetical protein